MMFLLKTMLKEEWRIHTNLFGSLLFVLFPMLIVLMVFLVAIFAPVLQMVFDKQIVITVMHLLFLFFGLNIGAFGLHGKEFMNRRFGHASLIAYSSRSLPVSERLIFFTFIVKDIIYYFFMFILPSVMGITIATAFISLPAFAILKLLLSLTLSFMIGLSFVCFFSMMYAHSLIHFIISGVLTGTLFFFAREYLNINLRELFPPLAFYFNPSFAMIGISFIYIIILLGLSLIFLTYDYDEKKRRHRPLLEKYARFFRFSKYEVFLAKDVLDILRSRGGLGKIIFSLISPMAVIWYFMTIFVQTIPRVDFLIVYSIFLGIYSPSIYNWLSEYDSFTQYIFLPVRVSDIITSKLIITALCSLFSVFIFCAAAFGKPFSLVIISFITFFCFFLYGLSVTVFLTGLYPNILFFSVENLSKYLILIIPAPILLIIASAFSPYYVLISLVLGLLSIYFFKKSFRKWDNIEQRTF
jgi:hypothetical protein